MVNKWAACLLASAVCTSVSGCGGGAGSSKVGAIPNPPTSTPPQPTSSATAVTILPAPSVQQFASTGMWTNLYVPTASNAGRFEFVDSRPSFQPAVRYTASGQYEVMLPGEDFGPVSHDPNIRNPTANDPFLVIKDCCGTRALTVDQGDSGFTYSAMATWARPDLDFAFTTDSGVFAFGPSTPGGGVPLSGTAQYHGVVSGLSDAKEADTTSNSWTLLPAGGTVDLDFDFSNGTLGGQLNLSVAGGMNPVPVGSYHFTQTVFSAGSASYSGRFDTSLPGVNKFSGLFTGPRAQETIGSWAVPFQYNGENHQALGAWMAKVQ